jgi:sn-glycerol 3-phosphate transport system permease protein
VFSLLVAGLGLVLSLVLAVMADRVVKGLALVQDAAGRALCGGAFGRRRAVAVHVRAVGRRRELRAAIGIEWNHLLDGTTR